MNWPPTQSSTGRPCLLRGQTPPRGSTPGISKWPGSGAWCGTEVPSPEPRPGVQPYETRAPRGASPRPSLGAPAGPDRPGPARSSSEPVLSSRATAGLSWGLPSPLLRGDIFLALTLRTVT